LIGRARV
jgi:hypothetical protein